MAGENYKPGKISIRSMSRLSTSVLWYFTHLLYTARSHNNSDQHTDIVLERVESDFKSISDLLKLSSDDTTAFLLNLVNEVSSDTSPSISYATEFVRDSLQPLDVLIMNRNESLKSQRKQWEAEFDRIVVEIQSSATGITFETNVITSSIEIFATGNDNTVKSDTQKFSSEYYSLNKIKFCLKIHFFIIFFYNIFYIIFFKQSNIIIN